MRVLRGRHALITGAAAGIGREIALELAREGCQLWLLDRNGDALEAVKRDLQQQWPGLEVVTQVCDLADPLQITQATQRIRSQWRRLHILVNNAGICYHGSTHAMTSQQWQSILAVNVEAPAQLIHELLPVLREQDEAHIVNICSMFGLVTFSKAAAYQMSKYALVGLSQALRTEYAHELGVSAICPGFVRGTAFFSTMHEPADRRKRKEPPAWLCCSPQTVARRTVAAIRWNRGVVVITPLARLMWWGWRLCPWLLDSVIQLANARRRNKRRRKLAAAQRS